MECSICLEPLGKGTYITPCVHKFHTECYNALKNYCEMEGKDTMCPICRTTLDTFCPPLPPPSPFYTTIIIQRHPTDGNRGIMQRQCIGMSCLTIALLIGLGGILLVAFLAQK